MRFGTSINACLAADTPTTPTTTRSGTYNDIFAEAAPGIGLWPMLVRLHLRENEPRSVSRLHAGILRRSALSLSVHEH